MEPRHPGVRAEEEEEEEGGCLCLSLSNYHVDAPNLASALTALRLTGAVTGRQLALKLHNVSVTATTGRLCLAAGLERVGSTIVSVGLAYLNLVPMVSAGG